MWVAFRAGRNAAAKLARRHRKRKALCAPETGMKLAPPTSRIGKASRNSLAVPIQKNHPHSWTITPPSDRRSSLLAGDSSLGIASKLAPTF
jgi:hypothetical protein